MTETTQTLRDDIAFMRALADEGVRPPLLGGPWLMAGGIIFGGVSLFDWVALRLFHLPYWIQGAAYIAAMLIFMALVPVRVAAQRKRAGHNAPANRAAGMAWTGVGLGIFAFVAATLAVCWRTRTGIPATMIPSAVLVLYGTGWTVAAAMTRQRFLWMTALASYVSAIVVAFTTGSLEEYLVFAVILVLVAVIPGYLLWQREPRDLV